VSSTKDKATQVQLAKFTEDAPGARRGQRDHLGFGADVPLAGGRVVTLGFDRGRAVVVHGLGADRGARVELRSRIADRVSKVSLDLRPESSDEALRVVIPDPSNLREGVQVQRLSGPGGQVIATADADVG
jgi:hypothetical protein